MSDLSLPKTRGFIDETGKRHGKLIVLSYAGRWKSKIWWNCTCDCGRNVVIAAVHLRRTSSPTRSCGCAHIKDLRGKRYGYLIVVKYHGQNKHHRACWECRCDCGNVIIASAPHLDVGDTKSCGCRKGTLVHGHSRQYGNSRTYTTWLSMRQRCLNPNNIGYADYGGRGITICQEWIDSFEAFLRDMKERPEGMTLDRINVNGDYEPGNCRWATPKQQRANQRKRRPKSKV
jgi:hypothetical protein